MITPLACLDGGEEQKLASCPKVRFTFVTLPMTRLAVPMKFAGGHVMDMSSLDPPGFGGHHRADADS